MYVLLLPDIIFCLMIHLCFLSNDTSVTADVDSNIYLCLRDRSPSIPSFTTTTDNCCSPVLPTDVYGSMVCHGQLSYLYGSVEFEQFLVFVVS